jgi:hypothetical protein
MAARGKPFEPGNKFGRGRPRGSRNKTTVMAQELLDSNAESVVRKCLVMALQGNLKAMQLCMDRVLPARRDLPVKVGPLPMGSAAEISDASEKILEKVVAGRLSPSEGQGVFTLIEGRRKTLETENLAQRVKALEEAA